MLCACHEQGNQNVSNSIFLKENTRRRLVLDFTVTDIKTSQRIKTVYYHATLKEPSLKVIQVKDSVQIFSVTETLDFNPLMHPVR